MQLFLLNNQLKSLGYRIDFLYPLLLCLPSHSIVTKDQKKKNLFDQLQSEKHSKPQVIQPKKKAEFLEHCSF